MRLPLLVAAVLAALASTAHAVPALEPLAPCYVSVKTGPDTFDTQPVAVNGSGFAPGSTINVAIDGVDVAQGVLADANGAFRGSVAAPTISAGERIFTVSATQTSDLSQTVSAAARVTNLTASLRPRKSSPRRSVTFAGRGFTDLSAPIYAHYVRKGAQRPRRTVRLAAAPTGACGLFSVRRRQFPFKPRAGKWIVRIDQAAEYGADVPAVQVDVSVRRVR